MGAVKISDIIIPEVFAPYVTEKLPTESILIQSGIVVPDPALDALALKGGKLINMPFFKDLTGEDEVLSDSVALTPTGITTDQDVAALLMRGKAWGVNDLAESLSGADPMGAIATLVARFWGVKEQNILIKLLTGVFLDNAANGASDLINDIAIEDGTAATAAALIGGEAVIDAEQKLGDNSGVLTAICMHSIPFARLRKAQLIDWVAADSGVLVAKGLKDPKASLLPYFNGLRVLVDDTCPKVAGGTSGYKYTSYLFANGAVGRGEGAAPVPVETDRDSLAGEDYLIHRRHFILHVRGIAYTNTNCAGASPTNTELALATNWNRVYPQKTIRVVKLVTNG